MADIKKVKKGCTKAILIYLGLGLYGFICAILGWGLNDIFKGHHDRPIGNTTDTEIHAPSPEEECVGLLYTILGSDSGHAMSGRQIAALDDGVLETDWAGSVLSPDALKGLFSINLPTNDTDNLPRMGLYKESVSGGTINFSTADAQLANHSITSDEFPIRPACQADIRIVYEDWCTSESLPEESERMLVEQRGNGILTLYHTVMRRGDNDERIYFPEYRNIVVYVYPDGDSLLTTCGYEATKRIYRYQKQ